MTKPHQQDQAEPFFIAEEVEPELLAAGYVLEPPGYSSFQRCGGSSLIKLSR